MAVDKPMSNNATSRDERRNLRLEELLAHDTQVRDAQSLESVNNTIAASEKPLSHIVAKILEGYADRPALGQRAFEMVTDGATNRTTTHLLPEFETITYSHVAQRVNDLASAWYHDAEHGLRAGDFVDILGFTSSDYTVIDLACIQLGLVSVPLQTSAAVGQLAPIISETAPRILASSIDLLDTAVDSILAGTSPEMLVVFDYNENDDDQRDVFDAARERLRAADDSVIVESLHTVLDRGDALPPAPLHSAGEGENPMATIFYTSGSTGTPKGAIYTESMMATPWHAGAHFHGVELPTAIHINFMPMSHLYGRHWLTMTLATGGTAYFAAKSDLSTLFEDIQLVRPTAMNFVPRVCDMVFQHFQSELDKRTVDSADAEQAADEVKADIREKFLGGRVVSAMCGTAPLSSEMASFIESCLDVPLDDGFGSTEAGMMLVKGKIQRPPVIDYKLIDVPELGYFSTDSPHPRGELVVKTTSMFPGYYKRPEITAEMFDEDGYYLTGDVMAETGPDELVYVDRRKNVLKLSQGEFVALSRLEALFVNSPLIRQIFVYGNSERSFLLAVVVPTADAVARAGDGGLNAALNESIQHIAKSSGLNSYEIPRELIVETEPFTQESGLLSGVGKLLRPKLKEHYGDRLEQLYTDLADGQASEMRELRQVDLNQPALDIVFRATHALLGCATEDLVPGVHFSDLGGDSLSALSFSNLLEEIFGVEVPVGIIISAATDLERLAQYIDDERNSGARRPSFATVHGVNSATAHARDLTLDKFIDEATLSTAASLPRPHDTAKTVLLTGANGYLGRFLCLEWLERVAETDGTVICIVRGSTAAAARKRLDDAFDSGDVELMSHYRTLAETHLEVLAGDIGEPNLGLTDEDWTRLAHTVDLIVHPAALVNHVLPYSQLFGPNVVGTAELIKIALTEYMKPINYLSTVAVASQVEPSAFEEDADIRLMSAERVVDNTYANGYGNSKWAGEVLLREAHDLCGLPVAVFRSDMILAHSEYTGQLNVPDIFTRLLLSLLTTGLAPQSFYELDAQGQRQRAHYDGLPADFTADAIATLGARTTEGLQTYDVMNPHDDGISLDEFVDWLIDAGHPISRIADYDDWFERFSTAIRAMPEEQKQHSLMPLLHAYKHPGPAVHGSAVPAKQFQSAVQDAEIGADKDIPHLTPELVAKYVSDLKQLKLLQG